MSPVCFEQLLDVFKLAIFEKKLFRFMQLSTNKITIFPRQDSSKVLDVLECLSHGELSL